MISPSLRLFILSLGFVAMNPTSTTYIFVTEINRKKIEFTLDLNSSTVQAIYPDIEYNKKNYAPKDIKTVYDFSKYLNDENVLKKNIQSFMNTIIELFEKKV